MTFDAVVAGLATSPADVVDDDDGSGAPQTRRPIEVDRVRFLVGVDEHEIERLAAGQGREHIRSTALTHLDAVGETRPGDVRPGQCRIDRLRLDAHHAPAFRQRACQPDGGVSAEGPDLEDAPRTGDAGQQVQELAVDGGDLDRRKARRVLVVDGGVEGGVVTDEGLGEVAIHASPGVRCGVGHSPSKSLRSPHVNPATRCRQRSGRPASSRGRR